MQSASGAKLGVLKVFQNFVLYVIEENMLLDFVLFLYDSNGFIGNFSIDSGASSFRYTFS